MTTKKYRDTLKAAATALAELMRPGGHIYIRLDERDYNALCALGGPHTTHVYVKPDRAHAIDVATMKIDGIEFSTSRSRPATSDEIATVERDGHEFSESYRAASS